MTNRGQLDEVVIDEWFHLEEMEPNQWWMRLCDARITITRTEDGNVRVDIERGSHEEVRGQTHVHKA